MPFGELLSRSWNIIRTNPRILWLFGFNIFLLLVGLLLQFITPAAGQTPSDPLGFNPLLLCCGLLVYWGITLYVSGLYSASVSLGVTKIESGESLPSIPDLLKQAHRFVGRVVGYSLVVGFTAMILAMIVIIPMVLLSRSSDIAAGIGILFLCLLIPIAILIVPGITFGTFALVIEDKRIMDGLERGWKVYTRNFWPVLGTYVGWAILSFIIAIGLSIPSWILQFGEGFPPQGFPFTPAQPAMIGLYGVLAIIQSVLNSLLGFFYFIFFAVYYFHLAKQMPGQPPAGEPLPESLPESL